MAFDHGVETQCRNGGHSCEQGEAGQEWPKFLVQPRVRVTEDGKDEQHRRKAEGNGKAGSEQDAGYDGQWSHAGILTTEDRFLGVATKNCEFRP